MSGSLLLRVFDLAEKIEQRIRLSQSRLTFQRRHLALVEQVIAIAAHLYDDKVSDPAGDP